MKVAVLNFSGNVGKTVGADFKLPHPADLSLTRGWEPTL